MSALGDAVWEALDRERWQTAREIAERIPRGSKSIAVQRSMVLKHLRSLERYGMAESRAEDGGRTVRWRRVRWLATIAGGRSSRSIRG